MLSIRILLPMRNNYLVL